MKIKKKNICNKKEFLLNFPYIDNLEIIQKYSSTSKENENCPFVPIDKDWKNRIDQNWWAINYKGSLTIEQKRLLIIRDKLLSINGEEVHLPCFDIHFDNIINYAQQWSDTDIIGNDISNYLQMNKYHPFDIKKLWNNNRSNTLIVAGYALSKDGMWRKHLWLIYYTKNKNLIVDYKKYISYYGYVLTYQQCNDLIYGYL